MKNNNYLDLTGLKFGYLTPIKKVEPYRHRDGTWSDSQWLCKCDCGNTCVVRKRYLQSGHTKSCGCGLAKPRTGFLDLTGQRFGRLVVIKEVEPYRDKDGVRRANQWLCKCDCGEECVVRTQYLRGGHTLSCGCYARQRTSESHLKENIYDLSNDDYGIGYTDDMKASFYFDKDDYDKIKDVYWSLAKNGYFTSVRKGIYLHRFIMDLNSYKDKLQIDHINHDKTDNRKGNLRICTNSENNHNKNPKKPNSSGCVGVYWHKKKKKWVSKISVDRKSIRLGNYNNIEDAIKARLDAEEKYYGEFSYENSQRIAKEIAIEKEKNNGNTI